MKLEFEKAERMLQKTDKLIEKYKDKSYMNSHGNGANKGKLTVKFNLPDVV
jgi:hypothetical protein